MSISCFSSCLMVWKLPLSMCVTCWIILLYASWVCNFVHGPKQLPMWYSRHTLYLLAFMVLGVSL